MKDSFEKAKLRDYTITYSLTFADWIALEERKNKARIEATDRVFEYENSNINELTVALGTNVVLDLVKSTNLLVEKLESIEKRLDLLIEKRLDLLVSAHNQCFEHNTENFIQIQKIISQVSQQVNGVDFVWTPARGTEIQWRL